MRHLRIFLYRACALSALLFASPLAADVPALQNGAVQETPAPFDTSGLPPLLSGKDAPLDAKARAGLKLSRRWLDRKDLPAPGDDGRILYLYGATLPSVVCAPLNVCDLELQPGERVRDLHVGDAVRWKITPAQSGPEGAETTHVIIKPMDVGLTTTMVMTTDRRVYYVKLTSSKKHYMPRVAFQYPDEIERHWAAYRASEQRVRAAHTLATGERVEDLDFGCAIEGNAPWKPIRVYNDGLKTVIQMPRTLRQTEAPTLLVLGPRRKEQLVNYRLHGDRYVVDQVFDTAVLVAGVGREQTRVTLRRRH
jgi:type IV secretion system protein VirB9